MYREALRVFLESALHCAGCGAVNRPGANYVELVGDDRAFCTVCSRSGPLAAFQIPAKKES